MLKKTGLTEIFVKYFDYNCLQYKILSQDHIEYVWAIIEQPEQAGSSWPEVNVHDKGF